MNIFFTAEEGYYSLTTAGTALFIVLTVLLLFAAAFLKAKITDPGRAAENTEDKPLFSTRQLVFSAAALALAFALSYVKIVHLPWGGSVTLCSMLFVTLIGYWYGPKIGLVTAFSYGILQFIQGGGGYILSPMQVAFDYIFAFAALGASGFFREKKNGLLIGYIISILLRGLFHSIGGYIYWMDYMPENFPTQLSIVYPVVYNYAYILIEGIITVVIIMLPPVRNAIDRVTKMARE